MRHDDEAKDWKINAQKALGEGRFEDFFRHLPLVKNDESYLLLHDAIKIAKQQKNLTALNAVSSLPLHGMTPRNQEILFTTLIDTWVEIGEIEKAVCSVVLYENETIPLDTRWSALGYSLLQKTAYKPLKSVYPYLKQPLLRQRIVSTCLQSRTIQQTLSEWLFWLKESSQLSQNHKELEAILDNITDNLLTIPDFSSVCESLKLAISAPLTDQLLIRLFERCATQGHDQQLQSLTAILPTSLQWLPAIQTPFTTVAAFTALQQLSRSYQPVFLKKQLHQYLAAQIAREEKGIVANLITIARSIPIYEQAILNWGCQWLLENKQRESAFALLSQLKDHISKHTVMKILASDDLSESECQKLLIDLADLELLTPPADTQMITSMLPPEQIAAEIKQRRNRLLEETEAQCTSIGQATLNSPHYQQITTTLSRLIDCGLYSSAYQICQKIAPAEYRDESVRRLLTTLLTQTHTTTTDWELAQQIAALLFQPTEVERTQAFLKNFGRAYPVKDYRQALQALIQFAPPNTPPYQHFFLDCARQVLEEKDRHSAAVFLAEQKIFNPATTDSAIHNLAIQTTDLLMETCSDDELITLCAQMRKNGASELPNHFLSPLLARRRLTAALQLLAGESDQEPWPEDWQRKIDDALAGFQPTIANLRALQWIKDPTLQRRWSERLLTALPVTTRFHEERLKLLTAIVHDGLRDEHLITGIIAAINAQQIPLASKAVNNFTPTTQIVWRSIIEMIQHRQFETVLAFLWKNQTHNPALFAWTAQHYAQSQSPKQSDQLRAHLDYHYHQYQSLSGEDEKIQLCNSHYAVFSQCFLQWQKHLLAQQKYPDLIRACQTYLARSNPQASSYFDRRNYLETLLFKLAEKQAYKHILAIVDILATSEEIFAAPFDQLLETLLQQDALQCVRAIQKYFPLDYQDHWRIRLAQYYFHQNLDQAGLQELKAVSQEYRECGDFEQAAISAVKKLINQNKPDLAQSWCDELLNNARARAFEPIIKHSTRKGYLNLARAYLPKMAAIPTARAQLRQEIQHAYQHQHLKPLLGVENTGSLIRAHGKIIEYLGLSTQHNRRNEANALKNELIVECRSLLDKAFLAFCRQQSGAEPKGRIPSRYFPVISELKAQTLDAQLRQQLKNNGILDFPEQHPLVYDYLLQIQPVKNPEFQWLSDLSLLANQQKHDHNLPETPEINGRAIKMAEFLPRLLDGVCELLLKLSEPTLTAADLVELRFSVYFPMHTVITPAPAAAQIEEKKRSEPRKKSGLFGYSPSPTDSGRRQPVVDEKNISQPPTKLRPPVLTRQQQQWRPAPPPSSGRSSQDVRFSF